MGGNYNQTNYCYFYRSDSIICLPSYISPCSSHFSKYVTRFVKLKEWSMSSQLLFLDKLDKQMTETKGLQGKCCMISTIGSKQVSVGLKDIDVLEWEGDLLVVGVAEKDMTKEKEIKFENTILNKLDLKLGGLLAEASSEEDFTGKPGQSIILRINDFGSKMIGLIGLGCHSPYVAVYRHFGEMVVAAAKTAQASNVAVVLAVPPQYMLTSISAIASGTILGTREDLRFKSELKKPSLKSLDIIGFGTGPELEKTLKYVGYMCSGTLFGRELINAHANVLTPVEQLRALAEEASKIASQFPDVFSAKILNTEECKELGMSYFLGMAASANPPHFIHLCYKPLGGPAKAKLALVGKGLTFDSGDYNIKTGVGCSIEPMKFDMGASAPILGAAKAIGQIKPTGVEVHFIVAACENMISGTGMKPGYIVTASNGKAIEVNNTDAAEGRLTLADALVYACNQGVEKIIDLETLTGACRVALRPSLAGIFTPDETLAEEVIVAAAANREKLWRVPFEDSLWESMKSGVADMVNIGSRREGTALFLKQFVDEKVQWMHIDMPHLGIGFGVPTLVEWVLTNSS